MIAYFCISFLDTIVVKYKEFSLPLATRLFLSLCRNAATSVPHHRSSCEISSSTVPAFRPLNEADAIEIGPSEPCRDLRCPRASSLARTNA